MTWLQLKVNSKNSSNKFELSFGLEMKKTSSVSRLELTVGSSR